MEIAVVVLVVLVVLDVVVALAVVVVLLVLVVIAVAEAVFFSHVNLEKVPVNNFAKVHVNILNLPVNVLTQNCREHKRAREPLKKC